MANNPYDYFDPRHAEFEQRERIQQELRVQQGMLAEQIETLEVIAKPQRERDAIREASAKKLRDRWLERAPEQVRKALQEIDRVSHAQRTIPPPTKISLMLAVGFPLLFIILFVGFQLLFLAGFGMALFTNLSVLIALSFLAIFVCGTGTLIGVRSYKKQQRVAAHDFLKLGEKKSSLETFVEEHLVQRRAVATQKEETFECPFCSEIIKVGPKKCRHCGELL